MATQRQRRRVFYGAFASIFFLAAIGLLYLVWVTVRGIPLDEAERFGDQQTRLLVQARTRFLEKLTWVAGVHRDQIARIPGIEAASAIDLSLPATNAALSRLEELLGETRPSAFRIFRISESGAVVDLYPARTAAVPLSLPAARAKELVDAARAVDDPRVPWPVTITNQDGTNSFIFFAPIRPNGQSSFAGAVCLETAVNPLLRENFVPISGKSVFFLLEWPEEAPVDSPGVRPKLLWISSENDEPNSSEKRRWRDAFLDALQEDSSEIRHDPRGSYLTLPHPNEGDRLEIVSHVPMLLRWGVCMSTPYDGIHAKASAQRILLITLGSVTLGILAAAVAFFVVQVVQRERELKAVETSYQNLFAENPTTMLVLDEQGRIVDCNYSALRLLALSSKDAKGKKLSDVFESEAVDPLWRSLSEDENLHAVDVRWRRRVDGAESLAEVWGQRIGDRWMLMAHDVGERREFEMQKARLKRMDSMGALASTLAHDFNNLLGQIQIMVSNLRADLPANSDAAADLAAVEGKVEDASQLVAGILAFRENVVSAEPVHLENVLRDFAAAQRKVLPERVRLSFSIVGDLPSVWIAPAALRRVLDNLCKNAVDAMPTGGELSIQCSRRQLQAADAKRGLAAGVYAVVEVGDTGPGVSEAALEKLFQPFFTTKSGGRGTGLGLWTVYKILRQLGGGIHVQSRPGQGARFEVLLPHHPPSAENSWIRKEKFEAL
jgi:PAS domain S-box-containing protein